MPDGKLHVLNTAAQPGQQVTGQRVTVASPGLVQKAPTIVRAIQGTTPAPATTASVPSTPTTSNVATVPVTPTTIQGKPQVVYRQGPGRTFTKQIVIQNAAGGQQQLIVSNPGLAQQLASGKFTLATVNGQQVLIRTPNPPATTGVPVPPLAPQVRILFTFSYCA